jgi:hypothetical protein
MFVTSSEYEKVVTSILEEEEELFVAVAFWGYGADSIINRRSGKTVKLICNLASGATNPDVIGALRGKQGVCLKQHDRLHAKVFVGSKRALVGSANLSSSGLNLEGAEISGWEEAGLVTTDAKEIGAIKKWFDAMWRESREIKDCELEDARRKWKERRATRVNISSSSRGFSLAELSLEEISDRRIYLVIYRNQLSGEAVKEYRKYQKQKTGQPLDKSAEPPPIYEGWSELPKDAQLIDVYYGPRGELECFGVYTRTCDVEFRYSDGSQRHLAVCRKDDQIMGYPFKSKEASKFAEDLRPCIEEIWNSDLAVGDDLGKYIQLADVVQICRRPDSER